MKKGILLTIIFILCTGFAFAAKEVCTTIQDGTLYASDGSLITTGFNEWRYNYQAKLFTGMWCDYHPLYRPGGAQYEWCQENYGNVELVMKWNGAWLDNKDCDGDGLLDRHYGFTTYIGSDAWLINNMTGSYELDEETCVWEEVVKIVSAPADAYSGDGVWYTVDGIEIGPTIWGEFAIIKEALRDSCGEDSLYLSPFKVGLGNW